MSAFHHLATDLKDHGGAFERCLCETCVAFRIGLYQAQRWTPKTAVGCGLCGAVLEIKTRNLTEGSLWQCPSCKNVEILS